ncbi:MAG: helix-hairpin-helix domain-containing protein [Tuberibacillus sp.]
MLKEKWPYFVLVFFFIGIGLLYVQCQKPNTGLSLDEPSIAREEAEPKKQGASPAADPKPQFILVDLKGAVKNPGVYRMSPGDRVVDVVQQAGGLTNEADKAKVNMAKKLSDEMMVYIPKIGENVPQGQDPSVSADGVSEQGKININTASEQELQQIQGIGPSKAKAIIEYREKNGPFQTIKDLDKVSGIGEKTLEQMEEQITIQ